MELTQEQKNVKSGILKAIRERQVVTCGGLAGVGKSFLVSHIIKSLPEFAVCAFTGKATNVLRKKGLDASTIHSLIYTPVTGPNGEIIRDKHGNMSFALADSIPYKGIIVDEASMVSKKLYDDLLSFHLPIIFVGDHGQLEPVGSDVNIMANPDFKLETIHRNAGEIAKFAEWIRMGYNAGAFANRFPCQKVKFIQKWEIERYLLAVDQIICAYNKSRVVLNAQVRYGKGFKTGAPEVGDKVMCLKNNRQIGLFNGMQGFIDYLYHQEKRMRFKSEDKSFDIPYDPSQFGRERYDLEDHQKDDPHPFDWCYAITAHKSQGDEWDSVMVLEQICRRWDHRRWAYTAASRAKEGLVWVLP